MNAVVLTDLHAHTAWPFSRPSTGGMPSRFLELLDVLAQTEKVLEERQPELLLLGGDLTHRRHFISFRLYNALQDAIFRLTERVGRTIIITGNHDYEDDINHSLRPLRFLPNTTLYDAPAVDQAAGLTCVPYMQEPARMVEAFERAPSELPILAHYAAEGCPLESDYWLEAPLKLGELGRFPFVLFGHVHKPSEQLDGRVIYVGAPLHFDFGDVGPRGLVHYCDGIVERVPLRAPMFISAKWPRIPSPPPDGGYLRILNTPTAKLDEAKDAALNLGWLDAVAQEEPLPEEVSRVLAAEDSLAVDEPLLEEYVRKRCPEMPDNDVKALVEEGLALLIRARA